MHWKVKAAIQNAIARLPRRVSYAAYYRTQRAFGGLKRTDPIQHLAAGVETWKRIVLQGNEPHGKVFFEVGTGRAPIVPLAFWLMGAKRTITIDVNPYLKEELVRESLEFVEANRADVEQLFGALLNGDRMSELLRLSKTRPSSLKEFLDLCCIEYIQPGDASETGLHAGSIDFHTSYTVLEHIQPWTIAHILEEGNRIVRADGLFVHMVDYSDHFSHSDPTISPINFLQYSDESWSRYADNRFMYMNRLRHDDLLALFQSVGHRVLATTPVVDEGSRALLEGGRLRVDRRFETKPMQVLSIRESWIVSRNAGSNRSLEAPERP